METTYALKDNDILLGDFNRQYVLKVRDLAEEDRPREKLIKHGPAALTSAELLAIVLNVGTKKEEVFSMVSRIIREYGERNITSEKHPQQLAADLKIPIVKACQVVACFELGRRFFKTPPRASVIRTSKQAFLYLRDMHDLPKEHLRGIYLNSRYHVIHDEVISIGTLTSSIVHPREVFRPAIEYSAAAVLVAHNHPSGVLKANSEDIEVTKQLIEAGKILGIDLLDHLIIGKNKFISILSERL